MRDLPLKRHERVFHERVPLPPARARRGSSSPTSGATRSSRRWSSPGATAPAWTREHLLSREEMARRVVPARSTSRWSRCCARRGLGGGGTETERYLRIAMLRFLLLQRARLDRRHRRAAARRGRAPERAEDDTMTHQILKEMS